MKNQIKSTTAMLNMAIEHVKASVEDENTFKSVHVRTSSINKTNGRCLFDFEGMDPSHVAVGVVFKKDVPTSYYVVPGRLCPKILLVKPGSEDSKWHPYYCDSYVDLGSLIGRMLAHKPSKKLLNRLA